MAICISRARGLDSWAQAKLGISTLMLMENAGSEVARIARDISKKSKPQKVAVFCGRGNNGGDGFVAARHLICKGVPVKVYLVGRKRDLKGAALKNFNILENLGEAVYKINTIDDLSKLNRGIRSCGLIIDALLGIGISGKVKEPLAAIIAFLNTTQIPILSVDTPSGLNVNTGIPCGACIRAKATVSFVAAKKGFLRNKASKYTGKLYIANIGFPC